MNAKEKLVIPGSALEFRPESTDGKPVREWSTAEFDKSYKRIVQSEAAKGLRVAWLGNHTLDPLLRRTTVVAATFGLKVESFAGAFDQHFQEMLSEQSPVLAEKPDVIVLSLSLRKLAPTLVEGGSTLSGETVVSEIDRVIGSVDEWIRVARSRSKAHLLICNFCRPPAIRSGITDTSFRYGEHYLYSELNRRLAELAPDDSQVTVIDINHAVSRAGLQTAWNPRMYRLAKIELDGAAATEAAIMLARACRALAIPARKCLVVDLDNTLWGGVLGEEGPEGIRISEGDPVGESFRAFQLALLDIKARGVLLAICSKNNASDVEEVFRLRKNMPLKLGDFACRAVNWQPKHSNILSIAEQLNIGTDSLAFIDDNPAECELIRQMLPEVLTIELPKDPSVYADLLYELPDFDKIRLTAEDRQKTEQYAANSAREEHKQSIQDMDSFLKSLGTEIRVRRASAATLTRVHQLFAKTNQFNVTTIRYTPADIQEFIESDNYLLDVISAKDRFGDLGIIGLYLVRWDEKAAHLDSFVMSCRALGRGIESAACNVLKDRVRSVGDVKVLHSKFVPTSKNKPAADFFVQQGFRAVETDSDNTTHYQLIRDEIRHIECPGIVIHDDEEALQ